MQPILVWFRRDLRIADNPALIKAASRGVPVIPVFILDDADAGAHAPGGASRWWLHHSLDSLSQQITKIGGKLILRHGPAATVIEDLVAETGAQAVFWNRRYEPWAIKRDAAIKRGLRDKGVEVQSFNASLLYEPWTVLNGKIRYTAQLFRDEFRKQLRALIQFIRSQVFIET